MAKISQNEYSLGYLFTSDGMIVLNHAVKTTDGEYDNPIVARVSCDRAITYCGEVPEDVRGDIIETTKLIDDPRLEGQDCLKQADRFCNRCGNIVFHSNIDEYSYQCFECDEHLYAFETSPIPSDAETSNGKEQEITGGSKQKRYEHLFDNALNVIATLLDSGDTEYGDNLYAWLSEEVGMTDDEIRKAGFGCVPDKNGEADNTNNTEE
jgi:DNA-directed RNA polymerase subunit M/transcription elongation factor TFIIS